MKTNKINLEKLDSEYLSTKEEANKFGEFVVNEINQALLNDGVEISFPIQMRVKKWDSIKEKLNRVSLNIGSITDFQDLIGLRVIVLFPRDAAKVGTIISKTFEVIKQYNTKDRLEDNQFGYISKHFIVQLSRQQNTVSDHVYNHSLKAEIQVRTIAQHLWAEVSHDLQYKTEDAIPKDVSRDIYLLSAQLENVDKQLEDILDKKNEYRSGIRNLETDETLNVDLLEITLDALWPIENKTDSEKYDYLLSTLSRYGIITQRQLVEVVRNNRDAVLRRSAREAEYLRNLVINHPVVNNEVIIHLKNKTITRTISPELIEKVEKGIFYSHVALTVTAIQFENDERDQLDPLE